MRFGKKKTRPSRFCRGQFSNLGSTHDGSACLYQIRGAPKEATLAKWTPEQQLAFDIAFGLKKVTIPGFRKALKEEDRMAIAAAIVGHLKLCRWEFSKPPEPVQ